MINNKVVCTIQSYGRIPFINANGPIMTPILIDANHARALQAAGYKITIIKNEEKKKKEETKEIIKEGILLEEIPEENTEIVEETITEEVVEEEETITEEVVEEEETITEEVVEEEETVAEEVVEEEITEEVVEEDAIYTEEELEAMTRSELRKILNSRGISVKKQQSLETLRTNVLKSNPTE